MKWLSLHFCTPDVDRVLRELRRWTVTPGFPGFFYTIYGNRQHGPHVRVRVLLRDSQIGPFRQWQIERATRVVDRDLSVLQTSVLALERYGVICLRCRYRRESVRYLGKNGLAAAERYFCESSKLLLDYAYRKGWTAMERLCFYFGIARAFMKIFGARVVRHVRMMAHKMAAFIMPDVATGPAATGAKKLEKELRGAMGLQKRSSIRTLVQRFARVLRADLLPQWRRLHSSTHRVLWLEYVNSILHMTANKLWIHRRVEISVLLSLTHETPAS